MKKKHTESSHIHPFRPGEKVFLLLAAEKMSVTPLIVRNQAGMLQRCAFGEKFPLKCGEKTVFRDGEKVSESGYF